MSDFYWVCIHGIAFRLDANNEWVTTEGEESPHWTDLDECHSNDDIFVVLTSD